MSVTWSYCVVDAQGSVIAECDADVAQPTASVGKLFLLCEVAERISDGRLDPAMRLDRDPDLAVADSGIWQHLSQKSMELRDVCLLVACVSDNWASNVLLETVGLEAVAERARALGCARSGLHDRVRDVRSGGHPETLSSGSARELAEVARRIHVAAGGQRVAGMGVEAARLVETWLLTGVDLSLVAAPFRLDPLAHAEGRVRLWSKTGTDPGIRADVGVAWNDTESLSYAAIATWPQGAETDNVAFDQLHALGARLASSLW